MSGLAILCRQKGIDISGSDVAEDFVTKDVLAEQNIKINNGFDGRNVRKDFELVIISAAYDDSNPEVREAKRKKIPIVTYSEMLAQLLKEKKLIAISGVHGKTTTTALTAFLLEETGKNPGWLIGAGGIKNLPGNSRWGKSEYFVAEADEYQKSQEDKTPKFLDFKPEVLVITSIEMDHPDTFRDVEEVYDAFFKLAARIPRSGFLIANIDSQKVRKLTMRFADRRIETFGFAPDAKWRIIEGAKNEGRQKFAILRGDKKFGPFELSIPGSHNILNATAGIIICLEIGVSEQKIKEILPCFSGVSRRFQLLGEKNNVLYYDDFAHHPTEIKATLEAARELYPTKKIWVVFQAHTYSRTKVLLKEFASSFGRADHVLISEIFASARESVPSGRDGVSGRNLAIAISRHHQSAKFVGDLNEATEFLKRFVEKSEIVILMGAGDVYKIYDKI